MVRETPDGGTISVGCGERKTRVGKFWGKTTFLLFFNCRLHALLDRRDVSLEHPVEVRFLLPLELGAFLSRRFALLWLFDLKLDLADDAIDIIVDFVFHLSLQMVFFWLDLD